MKIFTPILLAAVVVLLGLVAGYGKFGGGKNSFMRENIIGTWTTEDGAIKMVIKRFYLTLTCDEINLNETHRYVTKFYSKDEIFFLEPTRFNKIGIFGMYEKIEYRDGSLFGGILISDVGYDETEFRKEW